MRRRLRAEGASDAEIGALREARFRSRAAERLAASIRRARRGTARVSAYRAERERVAALDPTTRGASPTPSSALRDAHFRGAERLRIEALDRLEAQYGSGRRPRGAANPTN